MRTPSAHCLQPRPPTLMPTPAPQPSPPTPGRNTRRSAVGRKKSGRRSSKNADGKDRWPCWAWGGMRTQRRRRTNHNLDVPCPGSVSFPFGLVCFIYAWERCWCLFRFVSCCSSHFPCTYTYLERCLRLNGGLALPGSSTLPDLAPSMACHLVGTTLGIQRGNILKIIQSMPTHGSFRFLLALYNCTHGDKRQIEKKKKRKKTQTGSTRTRGTRTRGKKGGSVG